MSKELSPIQKQLPAAFRELFNPEDYAGDLYDGVSGSFAVISFRGKVWRKKSGGEEAPILDANDEPVPSIPVVIVKAAKEISKIYYGRKYSEGDDAAPDCMSVDGVKPDASSPKPQATSCAGCKHNQWGSRITEAGKKAKECSDSRRVAVVPVGATKDLANAKIITNEEDGGVMLMRVPAMSLQDLATYGRKMHEKGFPYNLIGTRIGFDQNVSYPRLTFKALRPLTEEEIAEVAAHLTSDKLIQVLETAGELSGDAAKKEAEPVKTVDTEFEEGEAEPVVAKEEEEDDADLQAAVAAAQAKAKADAAEAKAATAKAKKAAAAAAKKEAAAPSTSKGNGASSEGAGLDSIMSELDELGG